MSSHNRVVISFNILNGLDDKSQNKSINRETDKTIDNCIEFMYNIREQFRNNPTLMKIDFDSNRSDPIDSIKDWTDNDIKNMANSLYVRNYYIEQVPIKHYTMAFSLTNKS